MSVSPLSIMDDSPIRFPGLFGDWEFTASSVALHIGGTSSFAPGTMDSWNYGDPKGNAVLIFSGLELPTEAKWYTFTNSGTEYLRPISSDRVLDLFVIGGADDISGVPVLLDENRQELK